MPTKVFIGRIAEGTSPDEIKTLFRKFGTVTECDVIANYGFVHMETEDEAKAAIDALDGYNVNGSHIHVELSTTNTQGRKKRFTEPFSRGNGRGGNGGPPRFEPYQRRDNFNDRRNDMPPQRGPPERPPPAREEYASEQVKDLLELYFRDPRAFEQYARTYYYGERSERYAAAAAAAPPPAAAPYGGGAPQYYDKRPEPGYAPPPRREDDRYGPPPPYDAGRGMVRDDRLPPRDYAPYQGRP